MLKLKVNLQPFRLKALVYLQHHVISLIFNISTKYFKILIYKEEYIWSRSFFWGEMLSKVRSLCYQWNQAIYYCCSFPRSIEFSNVRLKKSLSFCQHLSSSHSMLFIFWFNSNGSDLAQSPFKKWVCMDSSHGRKDKDKYIFIHICK